MQTFRHKRSALCLLSVIKNSIDFHPPADFLCLGEIISIGTTQKSSIFIKLKHSNVEKLLLNNEFIYRRAKNWKKRINILNKVRRG